MLNIHLFNSRVARSPSSCICADSLHNGSKCENMISNPYVCLTGERTNIHSFSSSASSNSEKINIINRNIRFGSGFSKYNIMICSCGSTSNIAISHPLRISRLNSSTSVNDPRIHSKNTLYIKAFSKPDLYQENSSCNPPCINVPHSTQQNVYFASTTLPSPFPSNSKGSHIDKTLLFLGFVACAIVGALTVLMLTAIPTLRAMKKAAIAMEKLAEAARTELPGTMAAIRLSGMEISDLTMELSDLSQEITEGVRSSARAVQAAEEGLKKMGSFASAQTIAILQERASVPVEVVVKPAVAEAAKKTKMAVRKARQVAKDILTVKDVSGWVKKELKKRADLGMSQTKTKDE